MRGHQAVRCSARDGGFVMTIIPDLPSTEKTSITGEAEPSNRMTSGSPALHPLASDVIEGTSASSTMDAAVTPQIWSRPIHRMAAIPPSRVNPVGSTSCQCGGPERPGAPARQHGHKAAPTWQCARPVNAPSA